MSKDLIEGSGLYYLVRSSIKKILLGSPDNGKARTLIKNHKINPHQMQTGWESGMGERGGILSSHGILLACHAIYQSRDHVVMLRFWTKWISVWFKTSLNKLQQLCGQLASVTIIGNQLSAPPKTLKHHSSMALRGLRSSHHHDAEKRETLGQPKSFFPVWVPYHFTVYI